MNMPSPNASAKASAISSRLTAVTFSRKLDLKMSLNVIVPSPFILNYSIVPHKKHLLFQ